MPDTTELHDSVDWTFDGESVSLPVTTGTYGEKGIEIAKLRAQTKYVTLDTGFKNTGSTKSSITFIDGENGVLQHRGYPIEQLAEHADFLEVVHLLLKGELPNQSELDAFKASLNAEAGLPEGIKAMLDAMPGTTHPMGMLSSLLSALSGFYPGSLDSWTDEEMRWKTMYRLLANMPQLVAFIYRRSQNLPYIEPDQSLGYVENFLHMMFGKVDPEVAEAFDTLLILHADHEQNCSASTVRFVGS